MQNNNNPLNNKLLREFGLITGAIFVGLFGLLLPWLFDYTFPRWPWVIAAILSIWALIAPATLAPVYRTWMAIGSALGWLNTRIILGIMFFMIFLPIGLVLRVLGKDPLTRKIEAALTTYRVHQPVPKKNHVERPY